MILKEKEIHVWAGHLTISAQTALDYLKYLSDDERIRAERFHLATHRERFIAARFFLRKVLALYLKTPLENIEFAYSEHRKPFLASSSLMFNLSHSHDQALCAIARNHPVGVDIERIQTNYHHGIANRYFAPDEAKALAALADSERTHEFYRIWSCKEALIKATGKGLFLSLKDFSVAAMREVEIIQLDGKAWKVISLNLHHDYQAAVAGHHEVDHVSIWSFFDHGYKLNKVYNL